MRKSYITVVGQAVACQSSYLVESDLPRAVRFQIHPTNIFLSSIEKTTGTIPGGKKVRMNVGSAPLCYICINNCKTTPEVCIEP